MDVGAGGSWKLDNFYGRHICIVPNMAFVYTLDSGVEGGANKWGEWLEQQLKVNKRGR